MVVALFCFDDWRLDDVFGVGARVGRADPLATGADAAEKKEKKLERVLEKTFKLVLRLLTIRCSPLLFSFHPHNASFPSRNLKTLNKTKMKIRIGKMLPILIFCSKLK